MSTPDKYKYSRLLPCPNCGGEKLRLLGAYEPGEHEVHIQCKGCGARVVANGDELFRTAADAVQCWNAQKRPLAA